MAMLEHTIFQRRNVACPFGLKGRKEIYKELEISRKQAAAGEYQEAEAFIAEVREEYGV